MAPVSWGTSSPPRPPPPPGEEIMCTPTRPWRRITVHTYLTRMESKGLVAIDRSQDPHRYTAAIDRELCARQARSQLLDKIYGGATGDLIAAFLKESHITPEERDRLRQLLDDMEV